jgi:large subunit ribosomal protein L24
MTVAKIKKNDDVIVIAGRDKGKRGEVLEVKKDGRLVIAGVNVVKKHQRPNPYLGQQGGIVDKEAPIDASNVAIYNDETGKADRVGYRVEDGVKKRIYRSTQKPIGG